MSRLSRCIKPPVITRITLLDCNGWAWEKKKREGFQEHQHAPGGWIRVMWLITHNGFFYSPKHNENQWSQASKDYFVDSLAFVSTKMANFTEQNAFRKLNNYVFTHTHTRFFKLNQPHILFDVPSWELVFSQKRAQQDAPSDKSLRMPTSQGCGGGWEVGSVV